MNPLQIVSKPEPKELTVTPLYEFELKLSVRGCSLHEDALLDRIFEAGCDDAIVGMGLQNRISLRFARHAACASEAIRTAIEQLQGALPNSELIEIAPDLVGVSDIADILHVSRQYIRKVIDENHTTFPLPAHQGNSSLWHLFDVLQWMDIHKTREIGATTMAVAESSKSLNLARAYRATRSQSPALGVLNSSKRLEPKSVAKAL